MSKKLKSVLPLCLLIVPLPLIADYSVQSCDNDYKNMDVKIHVDNETGGAIRCQFLHYHGGWSNSYSYPTMNILPESPGKILGHDTYLFLFSACTYSGNINMDVNGMFTCNEYYNSETSPDKQNGRSTINKEGEVVGEVSFNHECDSKLKTNGGGKCKNNDYVNESNCLVHGFYGSSETPYESNSTYSCDITATGLNNYGAYLIDVKFTKTS